MNGERPPSSPPQNLPTLTEVVDLTPVVPVANAGQRAAGLLAQPSPQAEAEADADAEFNVSEDAFAAFSGTAGATGTAGGRSLFPEDFSDTQEWPVAAEKPTPAEADEADEELTQRVLARVERQIDLMLEVRVRETLTPVLTRLTDALMREARHELTTVLTDIVTRAVAQEMSRHRKP